MVYNIILIWFIIFYYVYWWVKSRVLHILFSFQEFLLSGSDAGFLCIKVEAYDFDCWLKRSCKDVRDRVIIGDVATTWLLGAFPGSFLARNGPHYHSAIYIISFTLLSITIFLFLLFCLSYSPSFSLLSLYLLLYLFFLLLSSSLSSLTPFPSAFPNLSEFSPLSCSHSLNFLFSYKVLTRVSLFSLSITLSLSSYFCLYLLFFIFLFSSTFPSGSPSGISLTF